MLEDINNLAQLGGKNNWAWKGGITPINIKNGIAFCRPCHKMFHIKYGFRNNNREQLLEFLK